MGRSDLGGAGGGRLVGGDEVQRRKAAMLPELLDAVRRRRRWRWGMRAATLVAALAVVLGLDCAGRRWRRPAVGPAPAPPPFAAKSPAIVCEVVRDLPDIVQRRACAPTVPAEWWIDDAELQRLLEADGRPSGLVRIAGHVAVTAAAVDPPRSLE